MWKRYGRYTALITTCAAAVCIIACATRQPEPIQMQTAFNVTEHRRYLQPGTNTLHGQGFMRQQGGGVVTCAGELVVVVPATTFFREVLRHISVGKEPQLIEAVDLASRPLMMQLLKQSQCDAQGNFVFHDLANGNWLVLTQVKWKVGYVWQGGNLLREVSLANGGTVQVLLSDNDFAGR